MAFKATQELTEMDSVFRIFINACKETPRGFFAPAIALWMIFQQTAERANIDRHHIV